MVEWRAEYGNAVPVRLRKQFFMPFPWCVGFGIKLVKSFAFPQTFLDQKVVLFAIYRQCVGSVGLYLDRTRASLPGDTDQLLRIFNFTVMVC